MQTPSNNSQAIFVIALLAVILFAAYYVLTMPDRRSASERIGDAASELSNGTTKAARQLENRTPGEKVGDAIKDATKK